MSEAIEMVIRDMLIAEGSVERVAKSLLKRLTVDAPSRSERITFMNFLIHAGYHREALGIQGIWFKQKISFPLMQFCFLLNQAGHEPNNELLEQLNNVSEKIEEADHLTHFTPWEKLNSKFLVLKDATVEKLEMLALKRKEKLIEKLEYLRQNRMIEEEEKQLRELIYRYPNDVQFVELQKQFKERWAEAILTRKTYQKFDENLNPKSPQFSREELQIAQCIFLEMKKWANKNPKLAYNMSIGLYNLELYNQALEILELSPTSLSTDWFFIELLIASRRFAECLDALVSIENKYVSDPETTFGSTYYRARALEGLGQYSAATQLLKSIVAIRPNYRSAHSLLQKLESARA